MRDIGEYGRVRGHLPEVKAVENFKSPAWSLTRGGRTRTRVSTTDSIVSLHLGGGRQCGAKFLVLENNATTETRP